MNGSITEADFTEIIWLCPKALSNLKGFAGNDLEEHDGVPHLNSVLPPHAKFITMQMSVTLRYKLGIEIRELDKFWALGWKKRHLGFSLQQFNEATLLNLLQPESPSLSPSRFINYLR